MDAILARLSQLEDEAKEQKSTIARLSSENARLSTEVRELRSFYVTQSRTLTEIGKNALPDGYWLWKPSGVDEPTSGRWVWSREMDAAVATTRVASRGRPASLVELPLELIRMIVDLLPQHEKRHLGRVCYNLLLMTSVDWDKVWMRSDQLMIFLESRIPLPGATLSRSARIASALDPHTIGLSGRIKHTARTRRTWENFETFVDCCPTVDVQVLGLIGVDKYGDQLEHWVPLLRFLNPVNFNLESSSSFLVAPTTVSILSETVFDPLVASWNRLNFITCYGRRSVPMLITHTDRHRSATFALTKLFKPGDHGNGGSLWFTLERDSDGDGCDETEAQDVDPGCIEDALAKAARLQNGWKMVFVAGR